MLGGTGDSYSSHHATYVREFASIVSVFAEKVDGLLGSYQNIARALDELKTCQYRHEQFSEIIARIQKAVDSLTLEGFSNVTKWVNQLDGKIEAVLRARLYDAVRSYTRHLLWLGEIVDGRV